MSQNTSFRSRLFAFGICFLIASVAGCGDAQKKDQPVSSKVPVETKAEPNAEPLKEIPLKDVALVDSHYVADKRCADCHEEIWKSYQDVGMAKSAYPFDASSIIEDFENADFYHDASRKHYEMAVKDGKFVMTRYRKGKNGQRINVLEQAADFVIGSGNHSRTYIYRDDSGAMFQLPVVWYTQEGKWGMAPGYDNAEHEDFNRPITFECMFCHNAYPDQTHSDASFLSPATFPKELPHGIGCQRCHGPGEEHIKAAEKDSESPDVYSTIVNPDKLPDQQQEDVCNQCHLQPTSTRTSLLRHFDRSAYSFRPGQRLADFQSYVELADAESTDLFEVNHHSYRMHQSKCYIESEGAMRCTSCHDPHAHVPKAKRVEHYRAKCLTCHGNDDCLDIELGRQPDSDCAGCHMPARRPEDAIHVVMTDHKIVRPEKDRDLLAMMKESMRSGDYPVKDYRWLRDEANPESNVQLASRNVMRLIDKDSGALDPLARQISKGDTNSDAPKTALAQAMLEMGRSDQALKLLNDVSADAKGTSLVQSNLGLGLIQQQKFALAAKFLEKAVTADPVVPEAHFNLGIAYINTNRIDDAIEQFRLATELQPNLANARFYFASALARDEKFENAESEFKRLLQIDPDFPGGALSLAMIQRKLNKTTDAMVVLENELAIRPNNAAAAEELALNAVEAVAAATAKPRASLDAAKALFKLTRTERNSRMILAVALVQNGYNEKALEAIGDLNKNSTTADRLLLAAIAKAKLQDANAAKQLYDRGVKKASNLKEPKSRLLETISQMADTAFPKQ